MRNFSRFLAIGLFLAGAVVAAQQQQGQGQQQQPPQPMKSPEGRDLSWAFQLPDKVIPPIPDDGQPMKLAGSSKQYTQKEIDTIAYPPDWFPEEHAPLPVAVSGVQGKAGFACGACHLMSGLGHPESANLSGLSAAYLEREMAYFKSGVRKNGGIMVAIAKNLSDDDVKQVAEYFAGLKPMASAKIVETDTVSKSYVNNGRMRLQASDGGTEPLGNRIVELPEDKARILLRDPHSGTVGYVPKGSLAKGEKLVTTGAGKTIACGTCHGANLNGLAEVPRIAGLSPIYIARQLYNFKSAAPGTWPELMKGVVDKLSDDDIIAVSAYVASRPVVAATPAAARASTPAQGLQ